MCGIAGIHSHRQLLIREAVVSMTRQLEHRGPDGEGIWTDVDAGIAFGHRRLAILDLSEAGHQPMQSPSGRWVVVLNGEIYNHLEIRKQIERSSAGFQWRGHSDTETLIAAIEFWGFSEAIKQLNGMFAIAVWDRKDRCLWLARDRMGEKPLYYGWVNGSFLFASELKSIRAFSAGEGLSICPEALSLLTTLNYIPAPLSMYREIKKLLPATILRISAPGDLSAQPEAYWELPDSPAELNQGKFEIGENTDLVETVLRQSVIAQMQSDVPLGALLSGGIDSSLIVALMQSQSTDKIKTFTIGFEEATSDESVHARQIARHLGTDHHEMVLTPGAALDQIPRLPSILDEPMGDSSQIPTMCVMELAKHHVTVALSGDGADELFGGYGRYRRVPEVWGKTKRVPRTAINMMSKAADLGVWDAIASLSGERSNSLLRQARYYLPRLARSGSGEELYLSTLMQWIDMDVVLNHEKNAQKTASDIFERVPSKSLVPYMMHADSLTYLPDDILVKVDRAAMSVSLETRAPFLDQHVVELSHRLPLRDKLSHTGGKLILRSCLERYVPRSLFERPKQGFSIPLDAWLRGPLRDWTEHLLEPRKLEEGGHFRRDVVRNTWQRHLSGKINAGHQLWSILMFQAWLENTQNLNSYPDTSGPEQST